MDRSKLKHSEEGYTIIESIVAMALFVTVVLFLLGSVGNLMFSNNTAALQKALRVGESEVAQTGPSFLTDQKTISGEFVIKRTVTKMTGLAEVNVKVYARKHPEKILVTLSKMVSLVQ
jgi:type II secretory pathway pseudopilin PulG